MVMASLLAVGVSSLVSAADDKGYRRTLEIELEGGPFFQTRNDVRIPSDSGTTFSLANLSSGPFAGVRGTLSWSPWRRHYFRALIAPFTAVVHGVLGSPVSFRGTTFAAGTSTEGVYRFNSYRLTYAYRAILTSTWELAVGFTSKIRDAEISVRQGNTRASSFNVGYVPLLHLFVRYQPTQSFGIVFDGDGLASPQGRAFDLALKTFYRIAPQWEVYAGARTIEGGTGGAGGTFNFAWLFSGFAGLKWNLD
jgi:hypothetical protein